MPTLLLRLSGPMQSWGTTSRFGERDTQLEPSKSGVVGLLCAALGRDRTESTGDLAALAMGVRVDREGEIMKDFHTATGVLAASGKVDRERTVLSERHYLADACFLVGLEGERPLLEACLQALARPRWPLALGRKSFPPGKPVRLPGGLLDAGLREALTNFPGLVDWAKQRAPEKVRLVLETPSEGSLRMDQPISSFAERCFGARMVLNEWIPCPAEVLHDPA